MPSATEHAIDHAVEQLTRIAAYGKEGDIEAMHADADLILTVLVQLYVPRGKEIADLYESIPKWYA